KLPSMQTIIQVPHDNRVLALADEIRSKLASSGDGLDPKSQESLARLLGLLHDLRKPEYTSYLLEWEIAVRALLASPNNQKFADELSDRIRYRVRPSLNPIVSIIRGGSPPTRVILGLGTLLYFAIPGLIIYFPKLISQETIIGIESKMLVTVTLAGALGSIVSIMVRIQDFGKAANADQSVLFMTGFFKPVVGSSFALFIFAVIKAGLIPITITPGAETYFFIALAFVSGFSERFARDVATATERKVHSIG
ncbi:MAG: hypothetical protein HOP00_12820, partial [Nitrospira sp.]|nr:hypothetical protein [Nitrospira sp.]